MYGNMVISYHVRNKRTRPKLFLGSVPELTHWVFETFIVEKRDPRRALAVQRVP
jgi:hypothetical protein